MSLANKIALAFALLAVLISAGVATWVNEGLAQLEDEYAYLWGAQIIADGHLSIPSPPQAQDFFIPFIVDHQGQRFSKYPLGWPVVLSFGERFDAREWVNPLLAGLAVWLIYILGKKTLGQNVGIIAAGLILASPLLLTYSGSYLSHTWGLVLSLALALSWLDVIDEDQDANLCWAGLPVFSAGFSVGVLLLSRPWTALGVATPFAIHGIILLWRGSNILRKRILTVGIIAILIGSLHFVWQFALTGDPWQNPYHLWWPYDKIGFGPGYGISNGGHTLRLAWINTAHSLTWFLKDLSGWGIFTWLVLPCGLWALRCKPKVWLLGSVCLSLVIIYMAYWVSGPRYFYEGLYAPILVSAAGIKWLGGEARRRRTLIALAVIGLVVYSATRHTPKRLFEIKDRYGFSQSTLEPFREARAEALTPALVIVHTPDWNEYGAYLHLEDPYLTSPFIFSWAYPDEDPTPELQTYFPERQILHYYPDEPGKFYTSPR